jgi:hypothetical protein
MQILEAFDLTRSYRAAAELVGCDHHTVAEYVGRRNQGTLSPGHAKPRRQLIEPYLPKVEEWVDASRGKIRADIAHERLLALGYLGSERTTRRAVAAAKKRYRAGHRRVYRPWVPEPGMWFQWDYTDGPKVNGRPTLLFCAWLAWSRFRVILPIWDRSLPSVLACLDTTLRRLGGCPTYALTDNEKTVTVRHIAGVAVRNANIVAAARHYGLTIATCVPADPESKGGVEATARIAQADLVPTEANLLPEYPDFRALERACEDVSATFNNRVHRVTRRVPVEMLLEERLRLHPLPAQPYTLAFGEARTVGWTTPVVDVDYCQYSAPYQLAGETVWVREHGNDIVIVHIGADGPREVARHEHTTPGKPQIDPTHLPPPSPGPLGRRPKAGTTAEAEFLAIGPGAERWLLEAAAQGATRIRAQMAEAVTLAVLHGRTVVDQALEQAAAAQRFGQGDVAAILAHQAAARPGPARQAGEQHSLQTGTSAWNGFGR